MEANSSQYISANTLNRYARAQMNHLLETYRQFKNQYQRCFDKQRIRAIKEVYQHGLCGKNSFGHAVVVDRIGNIKLQSLVKVMDHEDLVNYTYQRLIELAEEVLGVSEQVIWVIDLEGKIMQLASKKILDALAVIIANAEKFFPLMLHKLIFVNTPMLFDTIWAKIAPSVDKNTQEKIIMLAQEVETLYDFAPQKILPEFLGGDVDEDAFLYGQEAEKNEESSQEEQQVDFSSLKMALGGLKLSGNSLKSVSQTPLNTEADDK